MAEYDPTGPVQVSINEPEQASVVNTLASMIGPREASAATTAPTAPPVATAPTNEPLETRIEMQDKNGKVLELHSITGAKPASEMDAAALQYNSTGKAPRGFQVSEPKDTSTLTGWLGEGFNTVKEVIQPTAAAVGRNIFSGMSSGGLVGTEPITTGTGAQVFPDPSMQVQKQTAGRAGQYAGNLATSMFDTPEKLGMFLATAAVTPFLGAVNIPARNAAGVIDETLPFVFSKAGMLRNMGAEALAAFGGGVGANVATGQPVTTKSVVNTALHAGLAGLAGGPQALAQHWLTQYIPVERQAQVRDALYKSVTDRHAILKGNPNAITIGTEGSREGLTRLGNSMAEGLRGNVSDITKNMYSDIVKVLPGGMQFNTSATLRERVKDIARSGNVILDTINNPKANQKAIDVFDAATVKIGELVREEIANELSNAGSSLTANQLAARVNTVLADYKYRMDALKEGARAIGYLHQANGPAGFEAGRLKDAMMNSSLTGPQGTLLPDMRNILSGGRGLQNLPRYTEPNVPLENLVKRHIPPVVRNLFNLQPGPRNVPTLPSQMPVGRFQAPLLLPIGVNAVGKEAMERLME